MVSLLSSIAWIFYAKKKVSMLTKSNIARKRFLSRSNFLSDEIVPNPVAKTR